MAGAIDHNAALHLRAEVAGRGADEEIRSRDPRTVEFLCREPDAVTQAELRGGRASKDRCRAVREYPHAGPSERRERHATELSVSAVIGVNRRAPSAPSAPSTAAAAALSLSAARTRGEVCHSLRARITWCCGDRMGGLASRIAMGLGRVSVAFEGRATTRPLASATLLRSVRSMLFVATDGRGDRRRKCGQ